MTVIRTLAVGLVACGALATSATAAPLSWFGSQASLSAWYANQLNSAGNIYAPPSTTVVSNLPANWYYSSNSQLPAESSFAAPAVASPTPVAAPAAPAIVAPAPYVSAETVAPTRQGSQQIGASYSPPVSSPNRADAFINLGNGPYADASILTVGNPSPWYNSSSVANAFGGTPDAMQQASFAQTVLADVQHTFRSSGLDIKLTSDPSVSASHMMSVVSGASYGGNPDAIGITNVGANGFSFIDKLSYASNPDELAQAVSNNVAHELMHALGVPSHPDESNQYLDSAVANWEMLTDPDTKFSPAAVALLKSAQNGAGAGSLGAELLAKHQHAGRRCQLCEGRPGIGVDGAQLLEAAVPEPSTIIVWILSGLGVGLTAHRRASRKVA